MRSVRTLNYFCFYNKEKLIIKDRRMLKCFTGYMQLINNTKIPE